MHYIVSTLEVASCCVESRCANKNSNYVCGCVVCMLCKSVCAFVGEPSYLAVCLSEAVVYSDVHGDPAVCLLAAESC